MNSPKLQRVLSTTAVAATRKSSLGLKTLSQRQTTFCYTVNPSTVNLQAKQPTNKKLADSFKCCTHAMFPTSALDHAPVKLQRGAQNVHPLATRSSLLPQDPMVAEKEAANQPEQFVTFGQVEFCETPVKTKTSRRTSLGAFIQKIKQNDILSSHGSSKQKLDVCSTPSQSSVQLAASGKDQSDCNTTTTTKLLKNSSKKHHQVLKTQRSNSMSMNRNRNIFTTGKNSVKNNCDRLNSNKQCSVNEDDSTTEQNNYNNNNCNNTCSPSEQVIAEMKKGFLNVLRSQSALPLFHQFLVKEFSEENLEFWMNVEQFRGMEDPVDRMEKAEEIYETFVSNCAHKQVNMDARLHSDIKSKMAIATTSNNTSCSSTLFNNAQDATFKLMERDSYKRFLESLHSQNQISSQNQSNGKR
ncbi:putative uncharacterized protein DDB_G0272516 isoform X2 [Symsagittifera roscoffensis]|uniref:putative uncharacterized protein DDB_G0272516 isoform X2 n=1 Tax=Symsagittifera roscoffensis TaxID=84072 RepID=UPI00307BD788